MYSFGADRHLNLILSILTIFVIRILAVRYRLSLPSFRKV
jgi:uncharacterized membrane protein YeiH